MCRKKKKKKQEEIIFKSKLFINQVHSFAQQAMVPCLHIGETTGYISAYNISEDFEFLQEAPGEIQEKEETLS